MPIRTHGPESFIRTARAMLDRLESGDVVAYSAHFEAMGVGRVSGTTADGSLVRGAGFDTSDVDEEDEVIPVADTAPGKRSATP